jgi:preprotein translocase SecE subunit
VTRIRRNFDDIMSELRKVTWPTRAHVRDLTVLVFAISLVVGIYISILDAFFQTIIATLAG